MIRSSTLGLALRLRAAARPLQRSEYHFLVGRYIDARTMARATELGARTGVPPHEVMIAHGWLARGAYAQALADEFGLPFNPEIQSPIVAENPLLNFREVLRRGLFRECSEPRALILAAERFTPAALRALLASLPQQRIALATCPVATQALLRRQAPNLLAVAVDGLASRAPDQSARAPLPRWQLISLACLVSTLLVWTLLDIGSMLRALSLVLALLFIPIIALRVFAVIALRSAETEPLSPTRRAADADLPVYTILVPLYREAMVLPELIAGLARLDYPAAKLDIKLVLEASDIETLQAVAALDLPGTIEIVSVPDAMPRTKPKALNYALPLARGDYLVVYDAEDRPEPGQLRQAVAAFKDGPPQLACLQARLAIDNLDDGLLPRQFALEYGALFDGLLPALAKLSWPIPLGGTSNHFRVATLKWLAAWDPFNVTEDANLGTRLARNGYLCQVLPSTTFEEAPSEFYGWLCQRTRWLKGYMQTWLVHMRSPGRLFSELGPGGFLAFQIVVGGAILSPLVHLWFYAVVGFELATGTLFARPEGLLGCPLWTIMMMELASGYFAAMALALLTVRSRGRTSLLAQIPVMPFYWLLVAVAAHRAIWKFATARFSWEKTSHGNARRDPVTSAALSLTARGNVRV